jgi:hypothetical protein
MRIFLSAMESQMDISPLEIKLQIRIAEALQELVDA